MNANSSPAPRPDDDLGNVLTIAHLGSDLQSRALSLYVLDPAQFDELKGILGAAAEAMSRIVKSIEPLACPHGTRKRPRGCCVPTN